MLSDTEKYVFVPGAVHNSYLSLYKSLKNSGKIHALKNAFERLNDNYLLSFGDLYPAKLKKKENINTKLIKEFEKFNELFSLGLKLFLDSGGYQIQVGRIPEKEWTEYTGYFYDFVKKLNSILNESFSYFFFLDIIPMSGEFIDVNATRYWCKYSIEKLFETGIHVNETIFQKFLFVTHPNSIYRFDVWNDLMNFMVEKIQTIPLSYSVGGLVAGSSRYKTSHILHWVYGILFILWWLKKENLLQERKEKLVFHVLGLVEPVYVLSLYIIGEYLKEKYGIDIKFTYDGTAFLKKTILGRLVTYVDEKTLAFRNYSFNTQNLNVVISTNQQTVQEYVIKQFYDFWKLIDYEPETKIETLYQYHMGPFNEDIGIWLPFLETYLMKKIQNLYLPIIRKIVKDYVKDAKNDRIIAFFNQVFAYHSLDSKQRMILQTIKSIELLDTLLINNVEDFDWNNLVFLPAMRTTEVY